MISIFSYGCGGGGSSSASGTSGGGGGGVIVDPGTVGVPQSMQFVNATPTTIGLKGMGGVGVQETSVVTFKVLDTNKSGIAGQTVNFSLNTYVGGLKLVATSGVTGTDGSVSTIVQSGTIATPVKVTASVNGSNPLISTQSDQLTVSTGVPAQDGFSIAMSDLNPEALQYDNVTVTVTASLSDHFHNPVPDGTAVYFTTSGGSIQPSCITSKGACTVTWKSQNPRPANGRAIVLAYAIGEEAFLDLNGNGVADAGEFTDQGEAFRDDNEDGIYNPGTETFIDFNFSPLPGYVAVYNGPDGLYNGVLQGAAYTGAPKSLHVFSNTAIVMAGSFATITNSCGAAAISVALGGNTNCQINIKDVNGNPMPSGSTVAFSYTPIVAGITLTATNYTMGSGNGAGGKTTTISLRDSGVAPVGVGTLNVKVTTPAGNITSANYSVN
jgi:hypothetical protein